jgi:hypothetical protein
MQFRLRTLLIVLAIVAALVAIGVVKWDQKGIGQVKWSLDRVTPLIEQRNQDVSELANPKSKVPKIPLCPQ